MALTAWRGVRRCAFELHRGRHSSDDTDVKRLEYRSIHANAERLSNYIAYSLVHYCEALADPLIPN